MKHTWSKLVLLLGLSALFTVKADIFIPAQVHTLATLSDLAAYTPGATNAFVLGSTTPGDGSGGMYYFVAGDTTPNNSPTTIAGQGGDWWQAEFLSAGGGGGYTSDQITTMINNNSAVLAATANVNTLLTMYGTNVVWAHATDNALTNGLNFLALMERVKTIQPRGLARSDTNRLAVLVPPGRYCFDTNNTMWSALGLSWADGVAPSAGFQGYDFIDIIGMTPWAPVWCDERARKWALDPTVNESNSGPVWITDAITAAPVLFYKTKNTDFGIGYVQNPNCGPVGYFPNVSNFRMFNMAFRNSGTNISNFNFAWRTAFSEGGASGIGLMVTNQCCILLSNNIASWGTSTTNNAWLVKDCGFLQDFPVWSTSGQLIAQTPIATEYSKAAGAPLGGFRQNDLRGVWINDACNAHGWRPFDNSCLFGDYRGCFAGYRGFGADMITTDVTQWWCFILANFEDCIAGYGSFNGCSSGSAAIISGSIFRRCYSGGCSWGTGTLFDGLAEDCYGASSCFGGSTYNGGNGIFGTNAVLRRSSVGVSTTSGYTIGTNSLGSGTFYSDGAFGNDAANYTTTGKGYSLQGQGGGFYGTMEDCRITNTGPLFLSGGVLRGNTYVMLGTFTTNPLVRLSGPNKHAGPQPRVARLENNIFIGAGLEGGSTFAAPTNWIDSMQFDQMYHAGGGGSANHLSSTLSASDAKMMQYFRTRVKPSSVNICYMYSGTKYYITDDGSGNWVGAYAGSINYDTGAYDLTIFDPALVRTPDSGQQILVNYRIGTYIIAFGNKAGATNLYATGDITNLVSGSNPDVALLGTTSSSYTLPAATTSVLGGVIPDGTSITVDGSGHIASSGSYTLPTATTTTLGGVKVDGSTVTIASGVISAASNGGGTTVADGNTGTALTINMASGMTHSMTLNGNATLTFSNPPVVNSMLVIICTIGSSPAYTLTWPTTVNWAGSVNPVPSAVAGYVDTYYLFFEATSGKYYGSAPKNMGHP